MIGLNGRAASAVAVLGAALFGFSPPAQAATLCVNPSGSGGCFASINAALSAAGNNDTIEVGPGTYAEDVEIGKPISIVGADPQTTVVDATNLGTGFYVDGIDNPGLKKVAISGFTVENAKYEGILVANASSVTIIGNVVRGNNTALDPSTETCAGIPSFETNEGFDCGEGIHLLGTTASTVSGNTVTRNAGGILLSDDTGPTFGNVVSANVFSDNPFDCGITLASHAPAGGTNGGVPFGVFNNTISQNASARNGLAVEGAGAGVGLFASIPGAATYRNAVVGNHLFDNGLPGVAMHSHTPGQNLDGNVIVANLIYGNGADTEDAATAGPTGINVFGVSAISGTIVSGNTIKNETDDIVVNTRRLVDIHGNNLLGRNTGVANIGTGRVNAVLNWWGCAGGPGARRCSSVSGRVTTTPFLQSPAPL